MLRARPRARSQAFHVVVTLCYIACCAGAVPCAVGARQGYVRGQHVRTLRRCRDDHRPDAHGQAAHDARGGSSCWGEAHAAMVARCLCFTVVLHCASISVSVQHEDPTQKGCLRNRYACLMELLCRHRYTMFDGSQPFPGSPSISAGVFTWNMTREQVDEFKRTLCDRSTMWLSGGGARCWCCDALLAGCLCGRCASGVCVF